MAMAILASVSAFGQVKKDTVMKNKLDTKNVEANKNRKEGEPVPVVYFNGNASGKDGNLELDKKTKSVLSFRLWQ